MRILLLLTLFFTGPFYITAQRGLPPKEKTNIRHVTKYPQHLDFLPQMVKLLKVPDGWEVNVAAFIGKSANASARSKWLIVCYPAGCCRCIAFEGH